MSKRSIEPEGECNDENWQDSAQLQYCPQDLIKHQHVDANMWDKHK